MNDGIAFNSASHPRAPWHRNLWLNLRFWWCWSRWSPYSGHHLRRTLVTSIIEIED